MRASESRARVEAELIAFRGTRKRTLEMVARLPDSLLRKRPRQDHWSIGEILDHLVIVEKFHRSQVEQLLELVKQGRRPFIQKTFEDLDISMFFIPKNIFAMMEIPLLLSMAFVPTGIREMLTSSRLIPIQNPTIANPRADRNGYELREDLTSSLASTVRLFKLRTESEPPWDQMKLSHPLLGVLNIQGILRQMSGHEVRHQSQIRDALASIGGC